MNMIINARVMYKGKVPVRNSAAHHEGLQVSRGKGRRFIDLLLHWMVLSVQVCAPTSLPLVEESPVPIE